MAASLCKAAVPPFFFLCEEMYGCWLMLWFEGVVLLPCGKLPHTPCPSLWDPTRGVAAVCAKTLNGHSLLSRKPSASNLLFPFWVALFHNLRLDESRSKCLQVLPMCLFLLKQHQWFCFLVLYDEATCRSNCSLTYHRGVLMNSRMVGSWRPQCALVCKEAWKLIKLWCFILTQYF